MNVLRMRLEPSARMTPAHAHAHTTSVDLLIQRVVGLSPRAAMTDDLIGGGVRTRCVVLVNSFLQPFVTSQLAAKRPFKTC